MTEEKEINTMDEEEKNEQIDLDESFIVLAIPDDTVEIDITAKIYFGSEIREVTKHMDFPEVRAAIRDGMKNYMPDDALFTFAPTGREKLEALLKQCLVDTK